MSKHVGTRALRDSLAARRKAVQMSPRDLIASEPMLPGKAIPLAVRPTFEEVDLVTWAEGNRALVDELLSRHRALVFRGFSIKTVSEFERFIAATSTGRMVEYKDRSSPRHIVSDKIYTSTDYPADQRIALHNEGTYWQMWPLKIYFFCQVAPDSGGATPIADTRRVYERISAATRRRFMEKRVLYQRNFNQGFGLTWQTAFQTDDPSALEDYCRSNDISLEWLGGERLRARQVRPAVEHHPQTGEPIWFNHAAFFHITGLEPTMRETLLTEFATESLPFNTYYGDGSDFEPEVLEEIRAAYAAEEVSFPWQVGDVLLLDNMSVAHGRQSYTGERRILVGMADPHDRRDG
jgi:alpha-ketoglutarate-dependent taurine dioxygenase